MLVRTNGLVPVVGTSGHGLDRLLDDVFRSFPFGETAPVSGLRTPAVNAWEDENGFHVEAELPGVSEKDIEISVLENELRIAGGTETEKEEKETRYYRRERTSGKFSRVLRFPTEIEADQVKAKFENGVLRVDLPKAAASLPRRIEVKS